VVHIARSMLKYFCRMFEHDDNAAKSFDILAISSSVLHNYFFTKLFSNLYLASYRNCDMIAFINVTLCNFIDYWLIMTNSYIQ